MRRSEYALFSSSGGFSGPLCHVSMRPTSSRIKSLRASSLMALNSRHVQTHIAIQRKAKAFVS